MLHTARFLLTLKHQLLVFFHTDWILIIEHIARLKAKHAKRSNEFFHGISNLMSFLRLSIASVVGSSNQHSLNRQKANESNNFNWALSLKRLVLLKGKFLFTNLWHLCLLWFTVATRWTCLSFRCGRHEGTSRLVFWDPIFPLSWYGRFGRKSKPFLYLHFNHNIISKFAIFFSRSFPRPSVKIPHNEETWGFPEGNDVSRWPVIFWNAGYLTNN